MAITNSSCTFSQQCVATAQRLETEGKITREACVAILKGDEDTYSEKMLEAAQKVIRGGSPYFLSKQEIKALVERNRQPAPVEEHNIEEKLFFTGAKWLALHLTGLTIPYVAYKVYNVVNDNKKAAGMGVAAAVGLAAFVGLDDFVDA